MNERTIQLNKSWLPHLQPEFEQDYMRDLSLFLRAEKAAGKVIYPQGDEIFAALNTTALENVKVVVLGQDPYHGPNQAHGLCFSVRKGVQPPPSLKNIYKELETDTGFVPPQHGDLHEWAQQGVLLLNSVLTVQHSLAASHQGKGWERFTDAVVATVNRECTNVVFLLWGSYAHKKGVGIDKNKHLVLRAPHPSPLSAHRGFFGCRHFSQANQYLQSNGKTEVNWQLTA